MNILYMDKMDDDTDEAKCHGEFMQLVNKWDEKAGMETVLMCFCAVVMHVAEEYGTLDLAAGDFRQLAELAEQQHAANNGKFDA